MLTRGFGDLTGRDEELAEGLYIGGGGKTYTETAVENSIVGLKLDALQLELRVLRKDFCDLLQDTGAVDAFYVKFRVVEMGGSARGVPDGGDDVVAKTGLVLQRYRTIAAMEFEMVMTIDVAHDFIALDGTAMRTKFAVVEDFVGESERGFLVEMLHKVGVCDRLSSSSFGQWLFFEEWHKSPPSPSTSHLFALEMSDVGCGEGETMFTEGKEEVGRRVEMVERFDFMDIRISIFQLIFLQESTQLVFSFAHSFARSLAQCCSDAAARLSRGDIVHPVGLDGLRLGGENLDLVAIG